MPTLHVVGEIMGASELGLGDESSAFASILDRLALHPASECSFFCRWRLLPASSSDANAACWELLEGEAEGQTQSHATSPDLPIVKTGKQVMDLIWGHPINLHLATSDPLSSWPHLEFQIWSLDCFHQEQFCGSARVCVPMTRKELVLDLPIVKPRPKTLAGRLADAFGIHSEHVSVESAFDSNSKSTETLEDAGCLHLRLAVLHQGFRDRDVSFN